MTAITAHEVIDKLRNTMSFLEYDRCLQIFRFIKAHPKDIHIRANCANQLIQIARNHSDAYVTLLAYLAAEEPLLFSTNEDMSMLCLREFLVCNQILFFQNEFALSNVNVVSAFLQ